MKKTIILMGLIVGIILLVYWPIFDGFFQQDEWLAFGNRLYFQKEGVNSLFSYIFTPSSGHYTPLNFLAVYLVFTIFKLNYLAYAIISLFLHLIVTLLVYIFAKLLTKDINQALLTTFFFGIMAAGFQATAWPVADLAIHGAVIFILGSLICFFYFVKYQKIKYFIYSVLLLMVSLLFKEIGIGLFILLPFSLYLFTKADFSNRRNFALIITVIGLLYFLLRVSVTYNGNQIGNTSISQTDVTKTQPVSALIFNLLTFPMNSLTQTIIPPRTMVNLSYILTPLIPNSPSPIQDRMQFELYAQKRTTILIGFLVFIILTIIVMRSFIKHQNKINKVMVFSLVFVLINSVVYALSPERSGIISIMDSRNLYLPGIGTAILLSSFIFRLEKKNQFMMLVFFTISLLNIFWLRNELNQLAEVGSVRKGVLNTIKNYYPNVPNKVIFYTESDTAYYGLAEKILPFQSGFGQTILVWYDQDSELPKDFFQNKYLWEIRSEGYMEVNNFGFGYFRNFKPLQETVQKHKIPVSQVIAFSWNGDMNTLKDISLTIRARLKLENDK